MSFAKVFIVIQALVIAALFISHGLEGHRYDKLQTDYDKLVQLSKQLASDLIISQQQTDAAIVVAREAVTEAKRCMLVEDNKTKPESDALPLGYRKFFDKEQE